MNAMTLAIKSAGLPVPTVKERLWRALKETPGQTAREMVARMRNVPHGTINSQLSGMEADGLLRSSMVTSKGPRGQAKAYYALGDTWTRPPRKARAVKLRTQGNTNVAPGAVTTHAANPPAPGNVPATDATSIGHLTIAQAHSLYTQLHQLFGAKA